MGASHASKGGRRWRYYVSRAALTGRRQDAGSVVRIPAPEIENRVANAVGAHLAARANAIDGCHINRGDGRGDCGDAGRPDERRRELACGRSISASGMPRRNQSFSPARVVRVRSNRVAPTLAKVSIIASRRRQKIPLPHRWLEQPSAMKRLIGCVTRQIEDCTDENADYRIKKENVARDEALLRGAHVLLCSHLEGFFEDLIADLIQTYDVLASQVSALPEKLRAWQVIGIASKWETKDPTKRWETAQQCARHPLVNAKSSKPPNPHYASL